MASSSNASITPASTYNRIVEVQNFENTKLGVKGLLDSGLKTLPQMFKHDTQKIFALPESDDDHLIPVIDLSLPHAEVVKMIRQASATTGFFQILNHGVSQGICDKIIKALKAFHEEVPPHEKKGWYARDLTQEKEAIFFSNHDLFRSKAASWRDTLQLRPRPLPNNVPQICQSAMMEWDGEMKRLGRRLFGLLSEGLGLAENRLAGLTSLEQLCHFANYYPFCPEPRKTMGITSHTDPGLITVLLQDMLGGLQVLYDGKWVNLKPVPKALVVNIGDLLQIVSNDRYTSGLHRVVANFKKEARLSVAVTFTQGIMKRWYEPLPELVTAENPAHYYGFLFEMYLKKFFENELDDKLMVEYFRRTT